MEPVLAGPCVQFTQGTLCSSKHVLQMYNAYPIPIRIPTVSDLQGQSFIFLSCTLKSVCNIIPVHSGISQLSHLGAVTSGGTAPRAI